ncbi:hypothetical protein ABZ490_23275 [Streptomyces sp. NPDC005811]
MTTTRHALIIANDRYDDEGLGQLRGWTPSGAASSVSFPRAGARTR